MENVVLSNNESTLIAFPKYDAHEEICEWDVIGEIFSKAIEKKNLSKKQVQDMINEVRLEVRKR